MDPRRLSPDPTGAVRTALITGASGAIGGAIADRLAGVGWKLVLLGRNRARLRSRAATCGPELHTETVDFEDPDATGLAADRILARLSRLDALVHAAGTHSYGALDAVTPADFERQWRVNVLAPFILTARLLPLLVLSRGYVVFINSSIVNNPSPYTAHYASTKHALKGLADGLRRELGPSRIRVLSVFPGRTASRLQRELCGKEGVAYTPRTLLQAEDIATMVAAAVQLPETAEVTDLHVRPAIPPSQRAGRRRFTKKLERRK